MEAVRFLVAALSLASVLNASAQAPSKTPNEASSPKKGSGWLNGFSKEQKKAPEGPKPSVTSAPAFENYASEVVSDEKLNEVLERNEQQWARLAARTTGMQVVGPSARQELLAPIGMAWGMARADCEKLLQVRGAEEAGFDRVKPGVVGYLYRGGTFAGQLVETWYLVFTEKGLAEVEIQYVTRKNDSLRQFRSLLSELQKKYGMHTKEQDLRFLYLDLDANYENSSRKSGGREGPYWKALMYLDLYYSQILSQKSGQPAAVWLFDREDKLKLCAPGRFRNQLVYTCAAMMTEADKAAKEKSNAQKDL